MLNNHLNTLLNRFKVDNSPAMIKTSQLMALSAHLKQFLNTDPNIYSKTCSIE